MNLQRHVSAIVLFLTCSLLPAFAISGEPASTAGTFTGTITDSTGAVVPGAVVEVHNLMSGFAKTSVSDSNGAFNFLNLGFGHYHLTVKATGFDPFSDDIDISSPVAINRTYALKIAQATTTVTVEADSNDIVNKSAINETDLGTAMSDKLPMISGSTGVSSAITLGSPGITADSNGMFHPLGEHSDTTYSIDGQPVSDQQSKTFSNQISLNSIQSMQVIVGVIPPEYGDKASLVARTTTKSGLGNTHPTGDVSASYGSFGSSTLDASMGIGSSRMGNFTAIDGANSGRYLDTPEFAILHSYGNSEALFNRFDVAPTAADSIHLNLSLSRSWFDVPNQYDQQAAGQDQRSQIFSYNVAPFWTHIVGTTGVLSVNPYMRQDNAHYYPSHDIFSDTPATLAQDRMLRNVGIKVDYSYSKGINNAKFGADFNHTFLNENFSVGVTSPTYNAVCVDSTGTPVVAPGVSSPANCAASGYDPNPNFQPGLLAYDLTRGGQLFSFQGHTDIKEEALYGEDTITVKQWQFLLGVRGDNYNGLSRKYMLEPRVGITYQVKKTGTVLRLGYSRLMPTPYNENLVLSSSTGSGGLAQNVGAFGQHALTPATRNQYNTGFEQGFGKFLILDAEYFWKETKGDYDFDVLLNTPLTFPIQWRKSKIDGFDLRLTMPQTHGVSAYSVMGHARSRFFGPEVGGILFNNPSGITSYEPFRIDHDQNFQQTTNVQYQPKPDLPWYSFTWNYESGMVAGNAPFATDTTTPVSLAYLTPDQQNQIKLTCGAQRATLDAPLTSCAPNLLSSPLLSIPAPGTENPDRNPPRIAPRNLFDMAAGYDNLLRHDRYKLNATFTVTNLTNKLALYNFLSTFSGTHFVAPRGYVAQLKLEF